MEKHGDENIRMGKEKIPLVNRYQESRKKINFERKLITQAKKIIIQKSVSVKFFVLQLGRYPNI